MSATALLAEVMNRDVAYLARRARELEVERYKRQLSTEEQFMDLLLLDALVPLLPGRAVTITKTGDRTKVEISMPAPLPTYVVQVLPSTWTAAQIAEGARRFEVEAMHGLAMAGVP